MEEWVMNPEMTESETKMIKILMVLGDIGQGGVQTYAMNVLRSIDRSRFHIDFAAYSISEEEYSKEMREYGSDIYLFPKFKGINYSSYVRAFNQILDEGNYDIVHGHVSSSAAIYLRIAKKHHCTTIAHSHNAGYRGNVIERQIKRVFTLGAKGQADYWFGCSQPAAERMFGHHYKNNHRYHDIPNGIIAEKYIYDEKIRERIRNKYHIPYDSMVYGHVGSFTTQKNHRFLIEVFKRIHTKHTGKAYFMLVGDGALKESIECLAKQSEISDRVIFTGNVDNVHEYLMAMDELVFPSFFEGFPLALIEAQATGLPCLSSDTITPEVNITGEVMFTPLCAGADYWAEKAGSYEKKDRTKANDIIAESIYNINNSIHQLMELYEEMASKDGANNESFR